jgi:hypothetical protein
MARDYSIVGDQTVASPTDTCLTIQSTTALRPAVYWCAFSCLTDELDDMIRWTVQRFDTNDGTGDSVTPNPILDGYPAATCVVLDNHTAEPGGYLSGEIVLDIGVNTRSFQQWYAQPGKEIILPAVATEGVGFQPVHGSSTPSVICNVHYSE